MGGEDVFMAIPSGEGLKSLEESDPGKAPTTTVQGMLILSNRISKGKTSRVRQVPLISNLNKAQAVKG